MATKKVQTKKKSGESKLNMRITLILFALLPLIVSSLVISIVLYKQSAKEMTTYTHNSLVQVIEGVGNSFDSMADTNRAILKAYTAAPIIQDAVKDPEVKAKLRYLRTVYQSLLVTGPFSIVLGYDGGLMALNDRLKLRSMVVGEKDDKVYIASEEAAILRFFTSFVLFFLSRLTEIRRFRYETVYSIG